MIRSLIPVLVLCAAVSARAQDVQEPADRPVMISEPVMPIATAAPDAQQSAADAARSAAEAAKSAADSARASTAALEKTLAILEAQGVEEAPAEAAAALPAKAQAWNYQLGVSFLSVTGNANALTGKLSGQAEGAFGKWGTKIAAGATYGQTTAPTAQESEVTALNVNASAKGQRAITDRFNAYVLAGTMMDRVASIAGQGYGEAGVGLIWFENKQDDFVKSKLTTDLGFRYTRELRAHYYPEYAKLPTVEIYSPALKGSFRYALSKTAVFTQDVEILPDVVNTKNLRGVATSTLSAQIDKGIALALGFKVRYVGDPADGAETTDTELSAGVNWAF